MPNTISSYKNKSTSSRSSRSSRSSNKNNKETPKKNVDEFRASTPKVMRENGKRKLRIRHKLKELLARPLRDGATQREKEIRKIKISKYEQLLQQYSPVKQSLKGGVSSKKHKKVVNKNKTRRFRR
jgi:hypothetical protein